MSRIRNSRWYAFFQGTWEQFRTGDAGRTNPSDIEWNIAYDYGMNVGDALRYMFNLPRS